MLTLALLAPVFLTAQVKPIAAFYDKYKQLDNVTEVKLQGWLLQLAAKHADDPGDKSILEKVTHLRVLTMKEGNLVTADDYRQLLRDVRREAFEELVKFKEGAKQVDLLIREDKQAVTDVLIVVNSPDGFILLSLEGRLNFGDLNDLELNIEGSEPLRKLPEQKKDIPRA